MHFWNFYIFSLKIKSIYFDKFLKTIFSNLECQRKSLCVHLTLLRIFPILTLFFNIWKVKLASFFFRSEYLSFLSILCQIFSCYYTVFWSSFFSNPQNEYFIHFEKLFSFTKLLHFSDHHLVRCFLCFWYQFVF